jgi:alpha-1,6-mannosyltransferase
VATRHGVDCGWRGSCAPRAPADPALAFLRDPVVYPRINRAGYARTIYPPFAEVVFAVAGRVSDTVTGIRLVMLGLEAVGIICLLRLLSLAGLPRERILIYAWNPLALWSFANDGHVDAIVVGLLGLALLLRARHKEGWAGAALAGAVLTKLLPLVVVPAFLRGGRFWRPPLAGLLVVGCGYGLYSGAGLHVLGFLPSYGQEEGLVSGTGFWALAGLATLFTLPASATLIYAAIVAVVFLALAVKILWQPAPANDARALCRDTGLLAAAVMAATSPHYHWYFAWLALPAVVAPLACAALARHRTAPAHRGACPRGPLLLALARLRPRHPAAAG